MSPLAKYLKRIPEFGLLTRQPTRLVPYFALFLELNDSDVVITPKAIDALFDEARVRRPANTSDTIRKSNAFVRVQGGGYRLNHEGRERVNAILEPVEPIPIMTAIVPDSGQASLRVEEAALGTVTVAAGTERNVFVVYGRDQKLRRDLFSLLRAFGLNPLEFEEMAHLTGSTSPFTWQVVEAGFKHAQACIVLLSPDEAVSLRPDLKGPEDSERLEFQPRPNVLIEAGMALALHPTRTILLRVGQVRFMSDLDGKQYVNLTGSAESRNKLLSKLKLAHCDVKSHGDDWLHVGDFTIPKTTEEA